MNNSSLGVVTLHKFKKGDPAWLEFRKQYLTATDIPAIFGLSKYRSFQKALTEKVAPQDFEQNVYTRMGRILEPAVANLAEIILEKDVRSFGDHSDVVYCSETFKFSATPDAFIQTNEEYSLVELKTTSLKNLEEWAETPPLHYLCQLAVQQALLSTKSGYLVIMHPRYPDLPSLIFKTDVDVTKFTILLKEQVKRFWTYYDQVRAGEEVTVRAAKGAKAEVTALLTENLQLIHSDVVNSQAVFDSWWDNENK